MQSIHFPSIQVLCHPNEEVCLGLREAYQQVVLKRQHHFTCNFVITVIIFITVVTIITTSVISFLLATRKMSLTELAAEGGVTPLVLKQVSTLLLLKLVMSSILV